MEKKLNKIIECIKNYQLILELYNTSRKLVELSQISS